MPGDILADLSVPSMLSPGFTQPIEMLRLRSVDGTAITVTDGTWTLTNAAGTTIATVSSITGDGASLSPTVALGSGVAVGRHREHWDLTLDGGKAVQPITREAWVTPAPMIPMVSTTSILNAHPQLSDYPTGETGWANQILLAWGLTLRRALSHSRAALVWTADQLFEPHFNETMQRVCLVQATYTGGHWLALADYYETRKEEAWGRLELTLDTDGDGDVDAINQRPDQSSGFPPAAPVRG